jgi:V8-like Glu-specific endopeptidase
MTWRFYARAATVLMVFAACNESYDTTGEESAAVTVEPIIGGTLATQYPEAAYLNIDLSASGGYACSGTLIAPNVVMTAGHCVDEHSRFEVYVSGAYRLSTSGVTYDWNEHGAETVNPAHHDIGLVFLNDAVKIATYPTLSKVKVADGTKAINVGRVLNGAVQSNAYQAPATISAADKIGYPYDYTSTDVIQPGDSGGPVLTSGTHTIVAVNSGAGSGIQVLARVDLLADWISAQIAAHGGATGTANSGTGGAANAGTGGKSATGGTSAKATGGSSAKPSTGGTKATGGSSAKATGGSNATGGNKATGGGKATGGSSAVKPTTGGTSAVKATGGSPATGGSSSSTCSGTKEIEPDDTWATANKSAKTYCAALSSTTDVDWYSLSASVGTHVLEIVGATDASLSIGTVSGSTCVTSIAGIVRANITVGGATQTLCIKVSSSAKMVQNYQLNFN